AASAVAAPAMAGRGPLAPELVVAPTRRLLAQLRMRLSEAFPALLNVTFLHHDALAREAADAAGAVLPRALAEGVKEAILGVTIERLGGDLARYAASRPGMLAVLRRTIDDRRAAGTAAAR